MEEINCQYEGLPSEKCDVCMKAIGEYGGLLKGSLAKVATSNGKQYKAALCEHCFSGVLSVLSRERMVKRMFEEDEPLFYRESFGLVKDK